MTEEKNKVDFFAPNNVDTENNKNSHYLKLLLTGTAYAALGFVILNNSNINYQISGLIAYAVIGAVCFTHLTNKKVKEEKKPEFLNEIIENSSDAHIITDKDDVTIYTNKSFKTLTKDDINPCLDSLFKIFENSDAIKNKLISLKRQAAPAGSALAEFNTKVDGKDKTIKITCRHLVNTDGLVHWKINGITAKNSARLKDETINTKINKSLIRKIINSNKLAAALQIRPKKSDSQPAMNDFQRLFDEAPIGICIIDKNKKIIDTNLTILKILSKDRNVIEGSNVTEYIKEEYNKELISWLDNLSYDEIEESFEVTLNNGKETKIQLYANKFETDDNIVLHFIDLTERKNLEQQFAQSQKMQAIGQLAGGIAHDFNNLLTAMIGFADLLLLRHKPGDPSFSDINQIKQNANRASNMVRQLLAFSRQQTLKPKILDLSDVLSELSHLLRRLIGVNIELKISHKTNDAIVKADQGQIEQVLINLVVNSRDAMQNGGTIEISTEYLNNETKVKLNGEDTLPKGEWIVISVTDEGTGIPEDIITHIFEPFFSTKPVGAGTGLGLATVHGIVHQTGGRLSVSSIVGEGTTFKIYLPKHNKDEENTTNNAIAETEQKVTDLTGSASILLVEDEDAVRIFSSRALSNKGYNIVDVASGNAALKALEEKNFKPDLLITDVMMPEMDGTTLAKIVAEKYPEIKIIFISGYAEDRFKEHVGGNAYFLPKPFSLKQLAERVKEVINK